VIDLFERFLRTTNRKPMEMDMRPVRAELYAEAAHQRRAGRAPLPRPWSRTGIGVLREM